MVPFRQTGPLPVSLLCGVVSPTVNGKITSRTTLHTIRVKRLFSHIVGNGPYSLLKATITAKMYLNQTIMTSTQTRQWMSPSKSKRRNGGTLTTIARNSSRCGTFSISNFLPGSYRFSRLEAVFWQASPSSVRATPLGTRTRTTKNLRRK